MCSCKERPAPLVWRCSCLAVWPASNCEAPGGPSMLAGSRARRHADRLPTRRPSRVSCRAGSTSLLMALARMPIAAHSRHSMSADDVRDCVVNQCVSDALPGLDLKAFLEDARFLYDLVN